MSYVNAVCSKLFLTMRKADLEYSLLQITESLARLSETSGQEATELMRDFNRALSCESQDESIGTLGTLTSADYQSMYNTLMLKVHAKEQRLEVQKRQLETELQEVTTQQENMDSLIDKAIQKEYGIFKS